MLTLFCVLSFIGGIVSTIVTFLVVGWYLNLQERIKRAEDARKEMEDAMRLVEEQQKAAAHALQQSIDELLKRRQAAQKAASAPAPQVPRDPNIEYSVKERLKKAVELTEKQSKIDTKAGPEFLTQHNELELEKLNVLKTIIADGYDPVITIRYNTGAQEMLLSAYIQSISKGLA